MQAPLEVHIKEFFGAGQPVGEALSGRLADLEAAARLPLSDMLASGQVNEMIRFVSASCPTFVTHFVDSSDHLSSAGTLC